MRRCRGSASQHPVAIQRGIPAVQSVQTVQDVSAQLGLLVSHLREALGQVDMLVARGEQAKAIGHIEVVELKNRVAVCPGVICEMKREWQVISIVQGENVETQNCIAVGPGVRTIC
jgi:hypothetical protein